jgi:hypothetical protein
LKSREDANHQILIRCQQNLLKQGIEQFALEIHKLINSIWNKEELPEEWKESIIVPICQKGDKTGYSNYRGMSLVSPVFRILSNNLLSRFTPYVE